MTGSRLAVLGGTGQFGLGLAWRLALGGAEVVLGSRDEKKAEEAAARVRAGLGPAVTGPAARPAAGPPRELAVSGATNRAAAAIGDAAFLCVPFAGQAALLEEVAPELEEKLVICCAVIWPPGSHPETSAAEEAERILRRASRTEVRMAAAFQTIAAATLRRPPERVSPGGSPDIFVFADKEADRAEAAEVAALTGLRAVPAGSLRQARTAEAVVGLLMELNRGRAREAGLRLTGLAP